ncbi:unnamed protein product, partial [Polarella glacialis]
ARLTSPQTQQLLEELGLCQGLQPGSQASLDRKRACAALTPGQAVTAADAAAVASVAADGGSGSCSSLAGLPRIVPHDFQPHQVLEQLEAAGRLQEKAKVVEEFHQSLLCTPPAKVCPHMSEVLLILNRLLTDTNFKITLTTLYIIGDLVDRFADCIMAVVGGVVPGLVEKLGDCKIVIRQTTSKIFHKIFSVVVRMGSNEYAERLLHLLIGPLAHRPAHVRAELVGVITMALLTFEGGSVSYDREQVLRAACLAVQDPDEKDEEYPNNPPFANYVASNVNMCDFAHSFKTALRAPAGYKLNDPMPEGTPGYLTKFSADDWGSGHVDNPTFNFSFEETFPTKATRFMKEIVEGSARNPWARRIDEGTVSHPEWLGTRAKLCYHFSLKDSKCSHWMNCLFLHVKPAAVQREMKKYGCKCGRGGRVCGHQGCKYAHFVKDLIYPDKFELPGYHGSEVMRELFFSLSGIDESFQIAQQHIADTFMKHHDRLCPDEWCSNPECPKGVHLLPSAWCDKAFDSLSGEPPKRPGYFKKKNVAAALGVPKAKTSAAPRARPRVEAGNAAAAHAGGEEVEAVIIGEAMMTGYERMLQMPAPQCTNPWEEPQAKQLGIRWDRLSIRYNDMYAAWLNSKEMDPRFKDDGNIYYHPELVIGDGAASKVYLGTASSDGREVAVKVFKDDKFSHEHFAKEVKQMKEHSALPGILQYLTSFVQETVDGNTKLDFTQRVIILELIEGSLTEAMNTWTSMTPCLVGRPPHLQVIRYVKPDNIMVDRNGSIRLADFGISKILEKNKQDAYSSSPSPSHPFASPEAKGNPGLSPPVVGKVHRTSDLYSLGRVMQCMMDVNPTGEPMVEMRAMPTEWPKYHALAFEGLVTALLEQDPNVRAYVHRLTSVMNPHRIVASHPFFWSARTGLRFLVTLGNYEHPAPFGNLLVDAVKSAIAEVVNPGQTWFDKVDELEQPEPHATEDHFKTSPIGLLKFIRNKCLHMQHRDMSPQLRKMLEDESLFLFRFPSLVLRCWQALLEVLKPITENKQHAQLCDFFDRPFDLDSMRSGLGGL